MIHLRPFHPDDWEVIAKYQYPSIAQAEAQKLIDKWNVPTYEGKFHKFLAVTDDRQIVGYVSFIEAEEGTASFGVEIYAPFRRQGYAYAALLQLLTMANACNYHTASVKIILQALHYAENSVLVLSAKGLANAVNLYITL